MLWSSVKPARRLGRSQWISEGLSPKSSEINEPEGFVKIGNESRPGPETPA